jgi:hypothetical protein
VPGTPPPLWEPCTGPPDDRPTTETSADRRLKQEGELKTHALSLLEERVRGSESAQLAERVASLTSQLEEASQGAQAAREQKASMVAAAKVRSTSSRPVHLIYSHNGINLSHGGSGRDWEQLPSLPALPTPQHIYMILVSIPAVSCTRIDEKLEGNGVGAVRMWH